MRRIYKVGTRTSSLALKQTEEVLTALRKFYPLLKAKIIGIETYGDRDRITPISQIEGTDFFTRDIDEALLKGEIDGSTALTINPERSRRIDFAVHSAKDLSDTLREGLIVAAITKSIEPYDVLVSKAGLTLDKLPYGAKIGTSSLRRKQGLKRYRQDFQIVDIRGNVEERLKILDNSDLDAIVIAGAGLIRLRLENRIIQRLPFEILRPHPLQGALALVTRKGDLELLELLSVMDSPRTNFTHNFVFTTKVDFGT